MTRLSLMCNWLQDWVQLSKEECRCDRKGRFDSLRNLPT
jgi:hypothetical protein